MPSIWSRIALATVVGVQATGGLPTLLAQQPCASSAPCGAMQTPCPPNAGHAHVAPPTETPEPPPWVPTDPEKVPAPPETPPEPMQTPDNVPMPPETTPTPETPTPFDMPATDSSLAFGSAQGGLGSTDVAFTPNMMGDLLRAYRGVTFTYLQAGDQAVAATAGAVNFRNSKVAENNSAIPRDRVSFRYNYFKNAIQVRGLATSPELALPFNITSRDGTQTKTFQFNKVQPASRDYDVHLYTLGLEKTLFDGMASVEVRVPFARTLDSNLNFVSGVPVDSFDGVVPAVQPTPGQTLGQSDTQIQDTNLILKAVLLQDPSKRWTVSGGLGVVIPTGNDLNVSVVDYSDDNFVNGGTIVDPGELVSNNPQVAQNRLFSQFAFDQRTRDFQIKNQTWGISPYLAAAAAPTNRTFVNGFFQIDVPVNSSDWSFREQDLDIEQEEFVLSGFGSTSPIQSTNSASGTIRDQTLMHIDVGGGYWLYQNLHAKTVRGVAALMELHYTTTLQDANIVVVPETPITTGLGSPFNRIGPLAQPRLGNIANRVDILNLTLGSTILIGNHATLAAGYVAPLRNDLDRTFDGEANVQLNIYR